MTANDHSFADKLEVSRSVRATTDQDTIRNLIPGCVDVEPASEALDKSGIDFVATLRRGATVGIDIKHREQGVSKWWPRSDLYGGTPEPELTIECWSVLGCNGKDPKVGWTLDESKLTDYVLYTFDPSDTEEVFLLPFQILRAATRNRYHQWRSEHPPKTCDSNGGPENGGWRTESIYVPAWKVVDAVASEMRPVVGVQI